MKLLATYVVNKMSIINGPRSDSQRRPGAAEWYTKDANESAVWSNNDALRWEIVKHNRNYHFFGLLHNFLGNMCFAAQYLSRTLEKAYFDDSSQYAAPKMQIQANSILIHHLSHILRWDRLHSTPLNRSAM